MFDARRLGRHSFLYGVYLGERMSRADKAPMIRRAVEALPSLAEADWVERTPFRVRYRLGNGLFFPAQKACGRLLELRGGGPHGH